MKRTCIPKQTLPALPCHVDNPDVWLAETPADLECAKNVLRELPDPLPVPDGSRWSGPNIGVCGAVKSLIEA